MTIVLAAKGRMASFVVMPVFCESIRFLMGSTDQAAPAARKVYRGVFCGLGAALIWGAWPIVSKIGVQQTLSAFDIAALRFLVAGVLLAPVVIHHWRSVTSWPRAVLLAVGAGAPYTLLSVTGLGLAPASHGGIVGPSSSMLFSFVGGWLILSDRPTRKRGVGVCFVVLGIVVVGWRSFTIPSHMPVWKGDLLFVAAGFLWASYTVVFRTSGLRPLVATALVAVISMVVYEPLYWIFTGAPVLSAPMTEIAFQATFQGLFAAIIALLLHTAAVARLGVSRAAVFPGLVPAVAVGLSALVLKEKPGWWVLIGLVLVTFGMVFSLGIGTPWGKRPAAGTAAP